MNSCVGRKSTALNILTFAALAFSFFIAFPAHAQVVGANLSGTVKDASGALIPNAQISITHQATGSTRKIRTDTAGFYFAPNLPAGVYDVTTSSPGFSTQVNSGITLTVGAAQVLDITMRLGQATEKVEVTSEAPTVQLATSSLESVVNSTTVIDLPLNGRSWTDLAALEPGAVAADNQVNASSGSQRGIRGLGNEVTVSGARPNWNNSRLDGISLNDYANTPPSNVLGESLGVDAIQEFSVMTSNYSAEYGNTAGGVINAITRSGTNQFHGNAYEFLRNSALDARNYFDPPSIPQFRRNQFGASAGGPILKDRLFIFGDYEGIRQSLGLSSLQTVPSAAARSGSLCSTPSSSACTPHTITVDPAIQPFLPLYPLPNLGILPGSNGDIGEWDVPSQQVTGENFFTTRGDLRLSNKDNLSATYLLDRSHFASPGDFNDVISGNIVNRQVVTLEENHTFSPAVVNAVRIGINRVVAILNGGNSAINPLTADTSLGVIPGYTAPKITVSGLTVFTAGLNGALGSQFYYTTIQPYDDAFWTHGKHSFKFGGGVERFRTNQNKPGQSGQATFSSLTNFLENVPKKFVNTGSTTKEYGFRQTIFALYAQDDWRAFPNLTLNMGLRWEMSTVPSEVHGQIGNLVNLTDPAAHLGSLAINNGTLRNFEPRVGFAWDPFHDGKTAVRGGFGIFDVLPLIYMYNENIIHVYPLATSSSASKLPPGSFPGGIYGLLGPQAGTNAYFDTHGHRSYTMEWNLNLQREFPGKTTITAAYVGSHGVHVPFVADDVNMVIPTLTSAGYLFPSPIGSGTKINPNFGAITGQIFATDTSYEGLQVGVRKAVSHGLQLQASFTWGKSLDEGSASIEGDDYTNSISSLPFYNLRALRGPSDFNISRTLVISPLWQLPSPKSLSGPAAWITSGWQIGAIYKASDGVPFTALFGDGGDPLGMNSSDPYDFPNRLTGPGCGSLVNPGNVKAYIKTNCFAVPTAPSQAFYTANCDPRFGTYPQCFNLEGNSGRNIMNGPGLSNLDFMVSKDNRLSERFRVQFRAEAFNILNRPNFAAPAGDNTSIFNADGTPNPTAGLIETTVTSARQLQFALKLIW